MPRRTSPADVANLFIRCYLADLGEALGGCSPDQWNRTLEFFQYRCAYTGEMLTLATAVMDHAIPINKDDCGLHLLGNLIPCTSDANTRKHHRHYENFVKSPEKLKRIKKWFEKTGYWEKANAVGDLRTICSEKYATILKLCKEGRESAFREFGAATIDRKSTGSVSRPPVCRAQSVNVLPIELESIPGRSFLEELLERRQAWITVERSDGHTEKPRLWRISRLSATSDIIGNLRSRRKFRAGEWQKRGIVRVKVTLSSPEP